MSLYEELKNTSGSQFQDVFSKLMKEKYGMAYQSTSSYGNIGDMKVDGILNFNIAFAVYAPQSYNDKNVMVKLKSDFYGFLKHRNEGNWKEIQKYVIVIKRERTGVTPTVFNLISEFRSHFPVEIMTMEDLDILEKGYMPFSDDGRLLQEFKKDVTELMEYIIATDFAAEPFRMSLSDEITFGILEKWEKKKFSFTDEKLEDLKTRILKDLYELCNYLTILYVHALPNGLLLFNNDSWEAGERLRNEMQPQTYRIRCEVNNLLEELYNIK